MGQPVKSGVVAAVTSIRAASAIRVTFRDFACCQFYAGWRGLSSWRA